jgi:hypothetical protein
MFSLRPSYLTGYFNIRRIQFALEKARITSRRIRVSNAAALGSFDGGGRYRRFSGSFLE